MNPILALAARLGEIHRDSHTWQARPAEPDSEDGAIGEAVRRLGCATYVAARSAAVIADQTYRGPMYADVDTQVRAYATRLHDVVCLAPIVQAHQLGGPGPRGRAPRQLPRTDITGAPLPGEIERDADRLFRPPAEDTGQPGQEPGQ